MYVGKLRWRNVREMPVGKGTLSDFFYARFTR